MAGRVSVCFCVCVCVCVWREQPQKNKLIKGLYKYIYIYNVGAEHARKALVESDAVAFKHFQVKFKSKFIIRLVVHNIQPIVE